MKTLLALLLLSFAICPLPSVAQTNAPASTNNLTVVLDADKDALLRLAWKVDNDLRTNSLPPYSNSLPTQTYRVFLEGVAADALSAKAQRINRQRENEMRKDWEAADERKRTKALKALREP